MLLRYDFYCNRCQVFFIPLSHGCLGDLMDPPQTASRVHVLQAEDVPDGEGLQTSFASRTAVLADAQGLLTCYGVGEDGSANLPHAVVELCFTSSVRFLQPGLLLQASFLSNKQQKLSRALRVADEKV